MNAEVIVVSGLPRSGTSLMMQMLHAGGIEAATDNVRAPDIDNPRGYWELECVKKVKEDASWLPALRGRAVKVVSQLLYDLPAAEQYRIVFMERDLDEVLASQEKMLARLGRSAVPRADMARAYTLHLARLQRWLAGQPNMAVLQVPFSDLVSNPETNAHRLNEFVGGRLNIAAAIDTIHAPLYRNRK